MGEGRASLLVGPTSDKFSGTLGLDYSMKLI